MGRTNGDFPSYTKVEVDIETWPPNYWGKCRKCANCETLWPHPGLFSQSPCCNATTSTQDGSPDMRWPDAVAELLNARFNKFYEEYNEGVTDEEITHPELELADEVETFIDHATTNK